MHRLRMKKNLGICPGVNERSNTSWGEIAIERSALLLHVLHVFLGISDGMLDPASGRLDCTLHLLIDATGCFSDLLLNLACNFLDLALDLIGVHFGFLFSAA